MARYPHEVRKKRSTKETKNSRNGRRAQIRADLEAAFEAASYPPYEPYSGTVVEGPDGWRTFLEHSSVDEQTAALAAITLGPTLNRAHSSDDSDTDPDPDYGSIPF